MMGSRSPIGLDIGDRNIKAVQLSRGGAGGKPRLCSAMVLRRREPGAPLSQHEARRLHEVLGRQGFRGRSVVLAAPTRVVMTGIMSLPPRSSGAPIRLIAENEMARTHRCEPGTFEVRCWELPAAARRVDGVPVMAAACPHRDADAVLDALESVGLEVLALDIQSWAMLRACDPILQPTTIAGALDLAWDAATFALLHRNRIVYQRTLNDFGSRSLVERITGELSIPPQVAEHLIFDVGFDAPAEDDPDLCDLSAHVRPVLDAHFSHVARELGLSMSYAANEYRDAELVRLLLIGSAASIPGLDRRLGEVLEAQVTAVRVGDIVECGAALSSEARRTSLTIATGLALYEEAA